MRRNQIIYERSVSASIPIPSMRSPKTTDVSVVPNFFDPIMSSPPNDFIQKLYTRMAVFSDNVDDRRVKT